ncbi:nickel ABC transporter substrate-binding protein [Oceanospirillum sediminis]|uniref:Nickel ABC transporter, nickel/metallophore periplasmic binding protein n=1 Tax=Oceanospirillum sediminis TaxID=2760088 RepID=A0A839INQ9_9GAMM|nr:nickel ABC transporter substrate-binding protein [Oceanospirillum sediminis]MBB1486107.1 nickel ABC transporter, nickel/metallophore periplasmic binding protein [Oceanospirillum sediminis]
MRLLSLAFAAMISFPAWSANSINFSWSVNAGPLNPHQTNPNQMYAQAMVYEPLVRYARGGKVTPWLAEKWQISADGKQYTFFLREDVRFSNGEQFDAAAVKANFDQVLANIKKHSWLGLIKQLDRIEVVDQFVVRLHMKNAYYPTLQELTLVRPVRFMAPSAMPDEGHTGNGIKQPVGTGPWMRQESVLGQKDVFVRNPYYWGEKPAFEQVNVPVIPDPNARALAFESGTINLIYGFEGQISPDTFNRFRHDPRFSTDLSEPLSTRVLAMNTNQSPTRELAVRQAINHAVNREAIAQGIFYGTEEAAPSLFARNVPYADLDLPAYDYSLQKAAELLESAGWKVLKGDQYRQKNGQALNVELVYYGHDANQKAIAEVIQANLKQVGINIALAAEERSRFYKRQKNGEFDIIFNNTWGAPYDPHAFVSGMRTPSHADYEAQLGLKQKSDIDHWITQVLKSQDDSERQTLYSSILTTLHEQAVYLPVTYLRVPGVAKKELGPLKMGATVFDIPFESFKPE